MCTSSLNSFVSSIEFWNSCDIITYYFHFCNSIANVFLQTQLFLYMMKKSKYNEHNAAMKCFTVKKGARLNRALYICSIFFRESEPVFCRNEDVVDTPRAQSLFRFVEKAPELLFSVTVGGDNKPAPVFGDIIRYEIRGVGAGTVAAGHRSRIDLEKRF